MPLYLVSKEGQPDRLVNAVSSVAAIRHCAEKGFTAKTIANPLDVADIMSAGTVLEKADDKPAEAAAPEQDPAPEQEPEAAPVAKAKQPA